MIGTLYATNIGGTHILGLAGWRFAFLSIAVFSALIGVASWLFARDPRCSADTWRLQGSQVMECGPLDAP